MGKINERRRGKLLKERLSFRNVARWLKAGPLKLAKGVKRSVKGNKKHSVRGV